MFRQRKNTIDLEGVARLRVVNSPAYFKKLAGEARSIFDSPDAEQLFANVNAAKFKEDGDDLEVFPPVLAENSSKLLMKYLISGGTLLEFIPAKVTFEPNDQIFIRHDVLAEITLRDGIVTKIDRVPFPE